MPVPTPDQFRKRQSQTGKCVCGDAQINEPDSSSTTIGVAVGVSVLALLIIGGLLAWFLMRRRKSTPPVAPAGTEMLPPTGEYGRIQLNNDNEGYDRVTSVQPGNEYTRPPVKTAPLYDVAPPMTATYDQLTDADLLPSRVAMN